MASPERWTRNVLFSIAVCVLLLFSAAYWYGHFTLGESHGPFGFFGILTGVAAVGLILIWSAGPGWRRVTLYGIPSYVLIVLALSMLPVIVAATVSMILLVIAIMAVQQAISLKQGHRSTRTDVDDDAV
jgi:hypothetical protein